MKHEIPIDHAKGYPGGANIFYECLICGGVLPSQPADNLHCSCRNLRMDVDAGRFSVREKDKMRAFRQD